MGGGRDQRIDRDLAYLLQDAGDLAETALEREEISENEPGIWHFEWPNDLAILEGLTRARDAGEMDAEQERSYAELKARLRGIAHAVEGMRLSVPVSVFA